MRTPARSSASAARSTGYHSRSSSRLRACACSGPDGTAKRLGERLALLTRAAPDLPERRRSLRATIDWSYRLLDEPARHVFRVLSVFAGGATLEAVEAVADDGVDVPGALETLLDASLATATSDPDGQPRFGLLETIRVFAGGGAREPRRSRRPATATSSTSSRSPRRGASLP